MFATGSNRAIMLGESNMNNIIIKEKTEALEKHLEKHTESYDEENTENAVAYFLANKESIKYLLSAHVINDRQHILRTHLISNFGVIDLNVIDKLMNKEGIHTKKKIKFLTYTLPIALALLLSILLVYVFKDLILFILFSIGIAVITVILGANLEERNGSKALTYRLSDKYRSMKTPEMHLLLKEMK